MEKITSLTSTDIVADNIQLLKQLFPTIVKEDKIDLNELKSLLGENVEEKDEYYRFTWAGKNQARLEANKPTTATLRPNKADSKNWDTTGNIFIEGDNLEVLKLLQKSYANCIKVLYFDPPYNTGKDFVYKDNYADNLGNYLSITGQTNEEGKKLSTNTESDGRYHSNWLNMMYPRLRLSRNLMTDDGIIFLSIDDNELHNLRKLCDEVFGEENFVAQIVVEGTPKNDPYIVSTAHEYCLVYTKNFKIAKEANYGVQNPLYKKIIEIFEENKKDTALVVEKLKEFYVDNNLGNDNISNYKYCDELGVFRIGPIDDPQSSGSKDERINPNTGNYCKVPSRGWSCSIETWKKWDKENLILFPDNDEQLPSKKTYVTEDRLDVLRAYFKTQTRKDTDALKRMFGTETTVFSNPKPIELIKKFISICQDEELFVLDIFAGSGTTATAVLDLNSKDFKKRKFITIQIPEPLDEKNASSNKERKILKSAIKFLTENNKPLNLSEITKERIRRAGEDIEKILNIKSKSDIDVDFGFKAFKLDSSNIVAWDGNPDNLAEQLDAFANNIKTDRTEEDILFEILLKYGLDLTVAIEEKTVAGQKVYSVGLGTLFICLANTITPEVSEGIGTWKQELNPTRCRVIFKDTGFASDKDKVNAMQILKRFGVEEVNSI